MISRRNVFILVLFILSLTCSCSVHNTIRLVKVPQVEGSEENRYHSEETGQTGDVQPPLLKEQPSIKDDDGSEEDVPERQEAKVTPEPPLEYQEMTAPIDHLKKDLRRERKEHEQGFETPMAREEDAHWAILVAAVILGAMAGMVVAILGLAVLLLGVFDPSLPETERIDGQKNFTNVFKRSFSVSFSMFFIAGIVGLLALGLYLIYLQYGLLMVLLAIGFFLLLLVLLVALFNRIGDGLMKMMFIGWGN